MASSCLGVRGARAEEGLCRDEIWWMMKVPHCEDRGMDGRREGGRKGWVRWEPE